MLQWPSSHEYSSESLLILNCLGQCRRPWVGDLNKSSVFCPAVSLVYNCYGLNCVPPKRHIRALTPSGLI